MSFRGRGGGGGRPSFGGGGGRGGGGFGGGRKYWLAVEVAGGISDTRLEYVLYLSIFLFHCEASLLNKGIKCRVIVYLIIISHTTGPNDERFEYFLPLHGYAVPNRVGNTFFF